MFKPAEAAELLDIGSTTLRRWSASFEEWLSPAAQSSLTGVGGNAPRRYNAQDLALLTAIQQRYRDGYTTPAVQDLLRSGAITPDPDVVARYDDYAGDFASEKSPASDMTGQKSPVGDFNSPTGDMVTWQRGATELLEQLLLLSTAVPELATAVAQAQTQAAKLAEQQARVAREMQYQIEELRQERRALEVWRAEIAEERDAIPEMQSGPPSLGSRVRRLLKGS